VCEGKNRQKQRHDCADIHKVHHRPFQVVAMTGSLAGKA
jgi:hypothetical protein